jgi:hypothetical protein
MFLDFTKRYLDIASKYDFTNPDEGFIGLYGITFNSDKLESKKLYFDIQKPIDSNDFIFPSKRSVYDKYIKFIDRSRSLSDCVSVKYNINSNQISENFHIKFTSSFSYEEKDFINSKSLDNLQKAISIEFDKSREEVRRYYYIREQQLKLDTLTLLNIKEDPSNIKYIEYTANPQKGIIVFPSEKLPDLIYNCITSNAPGSLISYCNYIYDNFDLIPVLFGKYANSEKFTVYWDLNTFNFKPTADFYRFVNKC